MPNRLSRRQLTRLAAAAPTVMLVVASRRALAAKAPKASVAYQDEPNEGERCAGCRYFIADDRACELVAGDIAPDAWCSLYAAD